MSIGPENSNDEVLADLDPALPDRIAVRTAYRYKDLIKTVPGARWNNVHSVWSVPLGWASCLALRGVFRDQLEIGPLLTSWAVKELEQRINPALELRDLLDLAKAPNSTEITQIASGAEFDRLFSYQKVGASFLATARQALLADEQGSGKTAMAIHAIKILQQMHQKYPDQYPDPLPVLVVSPNSVKFSWARELGLWHPDLDVQVINGTAAKRRKQLTSESDVYVINWESVRTHSRLAPYGSIALKRCSDCGGDSNEVTTARCEVHQKELNGIDFGTVVVDECFAAGVTVSTPDGRRPVESLTVGDKVYGYDHNTDSVVISTVVNTMSRHSACVLPGTNSTTNHPYYVLGEGYRPIGDITCYDDGYGIIETSKNLPTVRRINLSEMEKIKILLSSLLEFSNESAYPVLSVLRCGILDDVLQTPADDMFANLSQQNSNSTIPDKLQFLSEGVSTQDSAHKILFENLCHIGSVAGRGLQRTSIEDREAGLAGGSFSHGQTFAYHSGTGDTFSGTSRWDIGTHSLVQRVGTAEVCHARSGMAGSESHSGSGWRDTSLARSQGEGPGTRSTSPENGLVRHPLLELRNYEQYRRMCDLGANHVRRQGTGPVPVYSITTTTGNYFADGVLVRNCHRSKDASSKQSRAVKAATGDASYRFALSGTPIANHPGEFWSILNWLNPNEWPTKSQFIDRYCLTTFNFFGGMDIVGLKQDLEAEFFRAVDPRMRRMTKDVILPYLPPVVRERRDVFMDTKQAKAYDEMQENMVAWLEDDKFSLEDGPDSGEMLVAASPLTQTIRLLQLASAYGTLDETDDLVITEPSCKISAFMEDLPDFGDDSIIVFAESRKLIELLSAKLEKAKIKHGLVTGAISTEDRQQYIDAFQAGKIKLILCTIKAGGTGLTLTRGRVMVFLQRSWSMIDQRQAEARNHRIGSEQHESVLIVDYVTSGTIEEGQIWAIKAKENRLEEIVRDKELLLKMLRGELGSD